MLSDFTDIFATLDSHLSMCSLTTHQIRLTNLTVLRVKPYKLDPTKEVKDAAEMEVLKQQGVVRTNQGP